MINVAVIGFGRMGQMHYDVLQRIQDINVKYIVDNRDITLDDKSVIIKKVDQLEAVLGDSELNAVVICASTTAHVAIIKQAIKHKKHVFCEKPISLDIDELKEVHQLAEKAHVKIQVGLNRRFDPGFRALAEAVKAGEAGDIQVVKITNRDPRRPDIKFVKNSGGLFYDFNTHDFDMVHFLTGEKVVEAFVMADALVEPELKKYQDVDTALITLKLASGALVMIDASRETNFGYDQRIEILGSKGMLKVDNLTETKAVLISDKTGTQTEAPHWSFVERYKEAYESEFETFVRFISDDSIEETPPGVVQMIESVRVAQAVDSAFKNNQPTAISHGENQNDKAEVHQSENSEAL